MCKDIVNKITAYICLTCHKPTCWACYENFTKSDVFQKYKSPCLCENARCEELEGNFPRDEEAFKQLKFKCIYDSKSCKADLSYEDML